MKNKLCIVLFIILMTSLFSACTLVYKPYESDGSSDGQNSNEVQNENKNDQDIETTPGADSGTNGDAEAEIQDHDTQNQTGDSDDNDLSEYTIVLDPGHGGGYSGAVYDGRTEKELTLQIGLEIKAYLNKNYPKLKVYMTRESDTTLSGDVVEDLELRAQYAKDVEADVLVSLHLNASEEHNQNGCMAFVSLQENVNEAASIFSEKILNELENLGITNHGVRTRSSNDMYDENGRALDYYAINRHCANRDIPGIIIEHCFIDGSEDIKYIDSDEDILALAAADAEGIISALEERR